MIEIKDLLLRFDKIILSEKLKIETIRNIISDITKIEIKSDDIKIKNHSIYLNIKPIYRNEIFMKQEEISKKLEESLSKNTPKIIK